jgi:predicted double-glycine peptidase
MNQGKIVVQNKRIFLLFLSLILLSQPLFSNEKPVRSLLEIRQNKVVIQQWDLSCGAAVLTTLLKYQHGVDTDEKTVAKGLINRAEYRKDPELLKRREGFSLLDLSRYSKKIGLQGKGLGRLSLDQLLLLAPVIVPISENGYNHFVIFRGAMNNRVLIADPSWGNRTLYINDFNKVWIQFPKLGHVGFVVRNPNNFSNMPSTINQLKVAPDDFTVLY